MTRLLSVGFLVLLAAASRAEDKPPALREYAVKQQSRHAYGLYAKDKKVGWAVHDTKLGKHDGKEVLISKQESIFEVSFSGTAVKTKSESTTIYSLEGDGEVIRTEESTAENDVKTIRKGERKGKVFVVSDSGAKQPREVKPPKLSLALQKKHEEWVMAGRKKGDVFENWSITLEDADIDVKDVYTYVSKKSVKIDGKPVDVHTLKVTSKGAVQEMEVRGDAVILRMTISILEERLEPEETAKKPSGEVVDFLALASVKVDTDLGEPKKVKSLTLEAEGLGDFKLPTSHRQEVVPTKQKNVFVIKMKRDFKAQKAEELTDELRKKMLQATPSIQCDEKEVRDLAKKIVGEEADVHKRAVLIRRWILKNLRQTYDANASTTLEVLKSKAGDCTEHSLLFVSFARALGIPAREVGGVGYATDKVFAWHAWAEFHDGHQWVSVDPTWNQERVDATHIKFSEGDDQAWLNVLGKLHFRVLKIEKD